MNTLLAAWLAETVLITYRGAKQGGSKNNPVAHMPLPSEYIGSFIVFGGLSLVPGPNGQRVAGLFGWGVVVATFLNLWDPKKPAGTVRQLGKTPKASSTPATTAASSGSTATR